MSKKTVLITGCSDGGLGAALAVAFHHANWRVLATARNPSKMSSLTNLGIETLPLDVTSETSLQTCLSTTRTLTHNKLDMLINNAGGGYNMPISDLSLHSTKTLFELNVFSVLLTTQTFLPLLLSNPHGATIVNHTSVSSVTILPFQGAYSASKAALSAFTTSLRLELAPFDIRVIELKTGRVRSNFFTNVTSSSSPDTTLPSNSIYLPAREIIESILSGTLFGDDAMDSAVWADRVVRDLTARNPGKVVWRGMAATLIWMSTWLIPGWVMEGQIKKMTKMDEVERRIREDLDGKKKQEGRGK